MVTHAPMKYGMLLFILSFGVALTPSPVRAHEGLHEQIVAVTAKIKRDPKNASLFLQRGELHRLHRDWVRAEGDYDRALRLQPGLVIVELARGKMLFESRRYRRAKVMLDRFLNRQPTYVEGLITRARVVAKLGDEVAAVHDFARAIELSSAPDPDLYLERAKVFASNKQEALNGLDEGIKRLGPVVTLELAAIELELKLRNYDMALQRLDAIAVQSERKEVWLVHRGEILREAGRGDEARAAFNAALVAIESLPAERRQHRDMIALQLRAQSAIR